MTVNVLPISDVDVASVPGNSLPFVIATLIAFKVIFVVVPVGLVNTRVELAPDSSVKNLLFSLFGSGILNWAWPFNTTSVNVLVSWKINSSIFMNV